MGLRGIGRGQVLGEERAEVCEGTDPLMVIVYNSGCSRVLGSGGGEFSAVEALIAFVPEGDLRKLDVGITGHFGREFGVEWHRETINSKSAGSS